MAIGCSADRGCIDGNHKTSWHPGYTVPDWKKKKNRKFMAITDEEHAQHLVGRVGVPQDVAEAALFLTGPGAGFITGSHLVVDGGMTVKMIYADYYLLDSFNLKTNQVGGTGLTHDWHKSGELIKVFRCITPYRINSAFSRPGIIEKTLFCSANFKFV